jgi:hypothetical protein
MISYKNSLISLFYAMHLTYVELDCTVYAAEELELLGLKRTIIYCRLAVILTR